MKFIFFIFLLLYFFSFVETSYAQNMSSAHYNIQILPPSITKIPIFQPDMHSFYRTKKDINFSSSPFLQKKPTDTSFSFSLSATTIDFGLLSATNPVTRSEIIRIDPHSNNGYVITTFENHPLSSNAHIIIPDTRCDGGFCNAFVSDVWNSSLTYGFGYRCDSINGICIQDNSDSTAYRDFADVDKNQPEEVVAKGDIPAQASITFKVNISRSQPNSTYNNIITFNAIPNY